MPEAPPKPKGKGLGKKLGPLPLWAWLGLGAGGALVLYLYLRGRTGDGDYQSPVELVTGAGGYAPQEAAGAGAPSQNGAPVDQLSPEVLAGLQSQIANLPDRISESLAYNLGGRWEGGGAVFDDETAPGGGDFSIEDFTDAVTAAVISSLGGTQAAPARGKPGKPGARGKPGKPGARGKPGKGKSGKGKPGKGKPGKGKPGKGKPPTPLARVRKVKRQRGTRYAQARAAVR